MDDDTLVQGRVIDLLKGTTTPPNVHDTLVQGRVIDLLKGTTTPPNVQHLSH